MLFSHYGASLTDVPADCGAAQSLLEDLDVAKPVDVDDADVTIYADPRRSAGYSRPDSACT